MEKLNRNNADIENLRDKKVAVRLVGKDAEIDFRKWLEENGICNNRELLIREGLRTEICYCVEGNQWDWCGDKWLRKNEYEILKWEIVEEKTYTIKDVVENEGKVYKIAGSRGLYKYENGKLLTNTLISSCWTTNVLNLKELLELEFIEYKPEPKISAFKIITFEDALKEMEQGKVCRSLYSGTEYLLSNNHFEKLNRNYTTLSYKEIKEGWVVID